MSARAEELEVTLQFTSVLDTLGVPHLVGGSVASSLLGVPRATMDVDIVAALREPHVDGLVQHCEGHFLIEESTVRSAIRQRSTFNLIHEETILKVDVFVLPDDALSREEMMRRQPHVLPGEPPASLMLPTAEDLILQKLLWYVRGGRTSDRQWHDVQGVLRVQGPALDLPYLTRWAAEAGIADLLSSAMQQATSTPRSDSETP